MTTRIPFLDLVTPHQELKAELCSVFEAALKSGGFIGGPMVETFEREFAEFCDTTHSIGVSSGTDALRFALIAAGVKPGDLVITVPNTFIATVEAISQAGARPVFVDVDERTYNLSAEKLREYLETQCVVADDGRLLEKASRAVVSAVVPVHLYGQMCDMDAIEELARRFHLILVEDACQAHGAQYFSKAEDRWRKAGSIGKAAAFSFYPGKNLGACGEAGAVTTNDGSLAKTVRMLRDHGQAAKYYHDLEGYNGRLDAIQAGILGVKLRHLSSWNSQRRQAAEGYRQHFSGKEAPLTVPFEPSWSKAIYHLFVIRVANRVELQRALGEAGIGTGIHYPVPLHLQKAYEALGYKSGSFPVAEKVSQEILSLPMYPGLTEPQIAEVVREVLQFLGKTPVQDKELAAAQG